MQRMLLIGLAALGPVLATATARAQATVPASGPRIQFASEVIDFGKLKSGEVVKTSFVFTNVGDQVLELTHIQPACGCTTAGDWSRRVEPGQNGSIPIQFNTMNFNGVVFKNVTVQSNDKQRPSVALQIKGDIWKPVDVQPQFAVLNLAPDAPEASTIVKIVANTQEPLSLRDPETTNPAFKTELTEVVPGKEFQLKVTITQPIPQGNVQSQIKIKTGSTNAPEITVTAWANVQATIQVMPAQIHVPPPPLAQPVTPSVIIQNNSTNGVALSDVTINAPGASVQVNETQPGRTFNLVVTIPAGFEVQPGTPVEVSMKTTHPRFPVLKIPVLQFPRAATAAVPAATPPARLGVDR